MNCRFPALLSAILILSPAGSMAEEKKDDTPKDADRQTENKDAAKEKPARSETDLQRIRDRNRRKAQEAWARDQKKRNAKDFAELEAQYQEINKNFKAANVKDLLEAFIKKWKDGNRVGCATLYLAQKSSGAATPIPRPPVRPNGSFRGLPQKANSLQRKFLAARPKHPCSTSCRK